MYNDYIICVDEKGQPYIAHANIGVRAYHKYIARFPNLYKFGKIAYAYTRQQLEAMQRYARGLGRKVNNKAETVNKRPLSLNISGHQKNITGSAKEGWSKRRETDVGKAFNDSEDRKSFNRSVKSTRYKDGDRDFDDANYKESNRIGDTDFFVYKRKDGTSIILEEDMKWILPKGVDVNSPEIKQAIQKFANQVESARAKDPKSYSAGRWESVATDTIDSAVRKALQKKSKNDSK